MLIVIKVAGAGGIITRVLRLRHHCHSVRHSKAKNVCYNGVNLEEEREFCVRGKICMNSMSPIELFNQILNPLLVTKTTKL